MWNGFCGDAIRCTSKNLLVILVILFGGLLIFFGYNIHYFENFFSGAHLVSAARLDNAASVDQFKHTFVRVQGSHTDATGVSEVVRDDKHPDGYTNSIYLVTTVGDRLLILRADPDATQASTHDGIFQGQLLSLTQELRDSIVVPDEAANQAPGRYLPFYLNMVDYKDFGYTSFIFATPFLLFALWILWLYLQWTGDFHRHPLMRRLARYGQPELLVQQVDAEMAGAHITIKKGKNAAEITPHWLIANTTLNVIPLSIERIVWVYRKTMKRKILLFITVRTTYYAIAYDNLGQRFSLLLDDAKTTELLQQLRSCAPHAIFGFDKRLWKLWRKTKDKSAFLVEARSVVGNQTLGDQQTALRGM